MTYVFSLDIPVTDASAMASYRVGDYYRGCGVRGCHAWFLQSSSNHINSTFTCDTLPVK